MKLNRLVKSKEKFSNPELVISGRIFYKGKLTQGTIGISDGKIVAVGKNLKGIENIDFGDKIILPGFTDMHVHFREPGMEHKENFETGSIAGLRGGITTYFDMPNTKPATDNYARIERKIELAKSRSYSDFGLYALLTDGTTRENVKNADAYKIFMSTSTETEDFGEYSELGRILSTFDDAIIAVHAEHKKFVKDGNASTLYQHYLNRKNAENEAVKVIIPYAREGVHVCHISDPESLNLLEVVAQKITYETTPHHMLLNVKSHRGMLCKVNPPLRTEEEQKKIFDAFAAGKIKMLASDHAPHLEEEKQGAVVPSGVPGVETMVPVLMYFCKYGRISIDTLVSAGAYNPAQLFGLAKGEIAEGMYADITVWDATAITEIKDKEIWSKCGWTPFTGFNAIFPQYVFLRGTLMIEDYELVGKRSGMHISELTMGEDRATKETPTSKIHPS